MAGNAELERKVNMSNVEAVQAAQAAQKNAEQKANQTISACKAEARGKVYTATLEKKSAIKEAKKRVQKAEKSQRTAWGFFFLTLCSILIVHPACLLDMEDFICTLSIWIWNTLTTYTGWLQRPYFTKIVGTIEKTCPFSTRWAWILRILSLIGLPVCIFCFFYGVYGICHYYKQRWCKLSMKVLLSSIIIIIVFAEEIRKYIEINLILIFIIIQVVYLFILRYLDKHYDSKNRTDDWKQIQCS